MNAARALRLATAAAALYLGVFWLWAGVAKVVSPEPAYEFAAQAVGGGVPAQAVLVLSVLAETALGAALLVRGTRPLRGLAASFALLCVFSALLGVAAARGYGHLSCGCFALFARESKTVADELWITAGHAAGVGLLLLAHVLVGRGARRAAPALAAALLVVGGGVARGEDVALVNAGFEDGLAGWTLVEGARNGGGTSVSAVELDVAVAHGGKAALRLRGDAATARWQMVSQRVAVAEGSRISLRVAARSADVHPQGAQFANANATIAFFDAAGRRLALLGTARLAGDRDWVDLGLEVFAPPGTTHAEVGLFLSSTGTLWFDDVRLATAPADATTRAGRAAAFDALAWHLDRTYPFFGLAGKPQADELFAKHREAALAAADEGAFVEGLRALLAELRDLHVVLHVRGRAVPTVPPSSAPRVSVAGLVRRLDPATLLRGRNVLAGWIGAGEQRTAYLLVASWQLQESDLALVGRAFEQFAGAERLVLDVRLNGGGDERQAATVAARFADADVVYARSVFRDPTLPGTDGFGPPADRVLAAAPADERFAGRVAVLQGPACVSSTEGFLLMCAALPRVTRVGTPSRGASGNPAPFEVLPGVTVNVSRWRSLTPAGDCIEGVGVAPDVLVTDPPADAAADADPVLERALDLLRR